MDTYKKKYEDAFQIAIVAHKDEDRHLKATLERIFPELAESEDEKIRKMLIRHIVQERGSLSNDEAQMAIAWLEKQGDKDKLIKELGEYKVKYTQEVLEDHINSMSNKDNERLRKTTIAFLKDFAEQGYENAVECIDWLEKQNHDGKKWIYEDVYLKEKEQLIQDGIDEVLENPQKYGLEKQGEQKPEPKFEVGDWVVSNNCNSSDLLHIIDKDDKNYEVETPQGSTGVPSIAYVDNNFHLWTIQDAKDGDVLYFSDETIVIFKDLYNATTFHSYCHIEDGEFGISCEALPDWWEGKEFQPATKEQRDLLFQKIKEAGYEWDTEKKELVNYGKDDNDKPKFKVDDWITNGIDVDKIIGIDLEDENYLFENGRKSDISLVDSNSHRWTIEDAKDGDVLVNDKYIMIYNKYAYNNYCEFPVYVHCFLGLDSNVFFSYKDELKDRNICPATKEQCDLLFQKMEEAGYEWDTEKKELKKFHVIDEGKPEMDYCFTKMMNGEKVSSAWNEENDDDAWMNDIICKVENNLQLNKAEINWLKSLKERIN